MKVFVIILSIVLGLGVILGVIGGIIYAGSNATQNMYLDAQHELPTDGTLLVQTTSAKVEVRVGNLEQLGVHYPDNKERTLSVTQDGNLVTVKYAMETELIWNSWAFFHETITITLPKDFAGKLQIENTSGNQSVKLDGQTLEQLSLQTTSGIVVLENAKIVGKTEISATSGIVKLQNVTTAAQLYITTESGSAKLENVVADSIAIEGKSGGIYAEDVKCNSFVAKQTSGGAKLKLDCANVEYRGESGSTRFELKNAKTVSMICTSGSVDGKIFGGEEAFGTIEYKTSSGRSNMPRKHGAGNSVYIETTSGNIDVDFVK